MLIESNWEVFIINELDSTFEKLIVVCFKVTVTERNQEET